MADVQPTTRVGSVEWNIPPVTKLAIFAALPPAALDRELKKAADTFASTGKNLFVHYVSPILSKRRELLLASQTRKKRYTKAAAQLWVTLEPEEVFFWHQAAKELRQCMKQNVLSLKGCLIHAGRLSERENYIWHAEIAVAKYLEIPLPQPEDGVVITEAEKSGELTKDRMGLTESYTALQKLNLDHNESLPLLPAKEKTDLSVVATKIHANTSGGSLIDFAGEADPVIEHDDLLDTLPDRFEYEQNMLYSHFAHYDYDQVRRAEGKNQTAMLRQLADRFDRTGKVLFYYYVVPRLCKQTSPPREGKTVTSMAAEIWRFMSGVEKESWRYASSTLKKQLGDGDILGLQTLQLDSLEAEVLRMHELAQTAIQDREIKRRSPRNNLILES